MIRFKHSLKKTDYFCLHPKLQEIVGFLAGYCLESFNHAITITSMIREKTTDSGVHQTGRAIDISKSMYNKNGRGVLSSLSDHQIRQVLSVVSDKYPRSDKKETILYHTAGFGWHFHVQVAYSESWRKYELLNIQMAHKRKGV